MGGFEVQLTEGFAYQSHPCPGRALRERCPCGLECSTFSTSPGNLPIDVPCPIPYMCCYMKRGSHGSLSSVNICLEAPALGSI